jgi:hypothetical protein
MLRHTLVAPAILLVLNASLIAVLGPACAAAEKPGVSLLLSKASAERQQGDVLFQCEAVLDNDTGDPLKVKSNFSSVFDGLELIVTDKDGKTLAQQGYTWHQSPFSSSGRDFVLKKGATSAKIVFPIGGLPNDSKVVKVRLVGMLPGSAYNRILSTETLEIKVKD